MNLNLNELDIFIRELKRSKISKVYKRLKRKYMKESSFKKVIQIKINL